MEVKQVNGSAVKAEVNGHARTSLNVRHKTLLKTVVFPTRAMLPETTLADIKSITQDQDLGALPHSTKKHTMLDRFIDKTVDALSSPKAIYVQTGITFGYMVVNTVAIGAINKFDPYPFLFLNFVYSLASGYATVFVLNSNRRQEIAAKDRSEKMHLLVEELVKKSEEQTKMLEELTNKSKAERRTSGF